ncbi:hypothetical protein GH714_028695 [Hevea brasiliensis]|uniref:Uncharacterized protein n=1 Tax=Hevea brasiliensis TaxID=3981 RepID=A0A6A6LL14_HEVBR|nr:hypothetical protein GH714_028695 [Hevea brasiliensis]
MKSNEDNRHENKRSYSGKDIKEAQHGSRVDEKGDGNRRRQDEMHLRKEKTDNQNGSKERMKERGDRTGENAKESESRKRSSHLDVKEDRKEAEKLQRSSAKEDNRKRGRVKDKEEDRARHKRASDSSRHKRRRSSSTSSRVETARTMIQALKYQMILRESYIQESGTYHLHPSGLGEDKFRGHLIASILSAGILPTLLLRLPGEGGQGPDHLQGGTDDSRGGYLGMILAQK